MATLSLSHSLLFPFFPRVSTIFGILIREKLSCWSKQQNTVWNAKCISFVRSFGCSYFCFASVDWLAGCLDCHTELIQLPLGEYGCFHFILFHFFNESIYMAIGARNIGDFDQIEAIFSPSWMDCYKQIGYLLMYPVSFLIIILLATAAQTHTRFYFILFLSSLVAKYHYLNMHIKSVCIVNGRNKREELSSQDLQ